VANSNKEKLLSSVRERGGGGTGKDAPKVSGVPDGSDGKELKGKKSRGFNSP